MKIAPVPPEALRSVRGLDTPLCFYQVLRSPAPLAGMPFPKQVPWEAIAAAGFESIVCLTHDTPPYDPSPLRVLRAAKFKDLIGGRQPDNPQREAEMLRDVVQAVIEELRAGRGVVVHCEGGTGRTGTVLACTLAALGVPAAEVLKYMITVNMARGKSHGWPEADWQKSQVVSILPKDT
jgi:protein tyrosine/serine phosphatase